MNQTLCGPGWADRSDAAVSSDRYPGSPVSIMCCAKGQKLRRRKSVSTCVNCDIGQYQDLDSTIVSSCATCTGGGTYTPTTTAACRACPVGYYQDEDGVAYCLPCIPGRFNNQTGQTQCSACAEDTFVGDINATGCVACPTGRFAGNGSAACSPCAAGAHVHAAGCRDCPVGWTSAAQDVAACSECDAGQYVDFDGATQCISCAPGFSNDQTGRANCTACLPGTFAAGTGALGCRDCDAGQYVNFAGATQCISCAPGFSNDQTGRANCSACLPGSFTGSAGTTACSDCDAGQYVDFAGATQCISCAPGFSNDQTGRANCTACLPGTFVGSTGATTCSDCDAGQYSDFAGSAVCDRCDLGQYGAQAGACDRCASGRYQDGRGATGCLDCAAGRVANEARTACQPPDWTTRADCEADYLDDRAADRYAWRCADCPAGASCAGPVNASGIRAKFGFARCPGGGHQFEACSFAPACGGAPNPALAGKYVLDGVDPARLAVNESCGRGYRAGSFLCSACAAGYSFSDLSGQCDQCPSTEANVAVGVFGVLAGLLGLVAYVHIALSEAGSADASDGAKSIGLSYVQVLSLLVTFPIAWPGVFVTLFRVGGAVTVLGTHLVNVKCLSTDASEAAVFYWTRLLWAVLPPLLSLACAVCWWALRRWASAWEAKMRASVVALLYLVWPGLCSEVFALFACRDVCGASRLRADLDELCFVGRHAAFAYGLGVPMLLLYIVGLPLAALVMVTRLHNRAARLRKAVALLKGHKTFGLFYSAFRPEAWWWEATVAARKIGIAALGVFGGAMETMQVHLTLLMVGVNIVLTARAQPYGNHQGLQRLEQTLLGCTCLTLWAGSVFNAHPRCEDGAGGTLPWCEFLSVTIGLADLAAGVGALLYYLHLKGVCTCLGRCLGRVQALGGALAAGVRRRTMERRQAALRRRTVDAPDARNVGNTVAEAIEMQENPTRTEVPPASL